MTCPNCGSENVAMSDNGGYNSNLDRPTCTASGHTTYICHNCWEAWIAEIVPAKGHHYVEQSRIEPTCTSDGKIVYVCSNSNYEDDGYGDPQLVKCNSSTTKVLKALGHDYVANTLKEVSCEEDGLIEYVCSRCNDSYQETIPAIGHSFSELTVTKEPTCVDTGLKEAFCENCNQNISEEIAALGHTYSTDWIIEKEATQFSAGLKYKVCDRCNERLEESIAKLPIKTSTVVAAVTATTAAVGGSAAAFVVKKKKNLKINLKSPATKSVTTYTVTDDLPLSMKAKTYLKVTQKPFEELQALYDAEITSSSALTVIDIEDQQQLDKAFEYVEKFDKDHHKNIGLVLSNKLIDKNKDKLKQLKQDEKLTSYVDCDVHEEIKTFNLIAPLYKFDIKSDSDLGKIGKLADFLQIPYVNKTINAYITAKKYKKHLEVEDKKFLDYSNIVGDIATVFGLEEVKEVTSFISTCNTLKSNLKKDGGANELKASYNAASSIIKTVNDVINPSEEEQ